MEILFVIHTSFSFVCQQLIHFGKIIIYVRSITYVMFSFINIPAHAAHVTCKYITM